MEHVHIDIDFEWSAWTPWDVVSAFTKHPARGPVPPRSGVYEIRRVDAANPDERLSIGSAGKLTARLYRLVGDYRSKHTWQRKQDLLNEVGGRTELLAIRWAVTAEYLALEHYLYRQHVQRVGRPPKYGIE